METIAPPSKSQSGSLASEERVPHFSLCMSSLFLLAKSLPGSPHSPERVPHSAPPVHSLFPAANSRSGSSASTETYQRFSSFIPSIFPTRKNPLFQETNVNPTYYKNPKTLTNQGTHNFSQI